jgi:Na+(H+)/acetate symporter ActP
MKKNMGSIDRTIRVIAAIVVGILYFTGQITGITAVILGIVAIVFVLTSFISVCPLYITLKLSTLKKKTD